MAFHHWRTPYILMYYHIQLICFEEPINSSASFLMAHMPVVSARDPGQGEHHGLLSQVEPAPPIHGVCAGYGHRGLRA